jgi:DNA methylase
MTYITADENYKAALVGEDWEYLDVDTQYLTHNIHRYSGKFIPQIAARVIQTITAPGDLVLDPYCGSGTTLLEAALCQRRCIGFDLNPLAVLIANVKVSPVSSSVLAAARAKIAEVVASLQQEGDKNLFSSPEFDRLNRGLEGDPRLTDEWFVKWFGHTNLRELLLLHSTIENLPSNKARDVALVAFSDILRRCSRAHQGYPNVMFDKNATDRVRPSKIFLKSFDQVIALVGQLSSVEGSWSQVRANLGDATSLPLEGNSVDAIVTHPPYIGSIPYAEYGLLSLRWLGADPKKLDRELTGGRRQSPNVVKRFEASYKAMFEESWRVLRPGRIIFLLVGNPVVKGSVIDLEVMTMTLAGQVGFELMAVTKRKGVNRRANKMGEESLLFFKKPEKAPNDWSKPASEKKLV